MNVIENKFSKADLQHGMIVKTGESEYMVCTTKDSVLYLADLNYGYMMLTDYDDDLRMIDREKSEYDIVEVFDRPNKPTMIKCSGDSIWKRSPTIKLTKHQIEDLLGYYIEIVGG